MAEIQYDQVGLTLFILLATLLAALLWYAAPALVLWWLLAGA